MLFVSAYAFITSLYIEKQVGVPWSVGLDHLCASAQNVEP